MKNSQVSIIEERQFITKEFADTLAGKTPAPYLRLHDPVQQALVALAKNGSSTHAGRTGLRPYLDRMIHFWREVSLAAFPCGGKAMDECYALLFESTFRLAQSEPVWAIDCLATQPPEGVHAVVAGGLRHFAHQVKAATIAHSDLVSAFTHLYAPHREQSAEWQNPVNVALAGELWFWGAIFLATESHENDGYLSFHRTIAKSAATDWNDGDRLHIRLIREAPQRASQTPLIQLMEHPILRLARLKYREGCNEQRQVLRFLNAQCIKQGFESEEDFFGSDLPLAHWTRDARLWANNMLEAESEVCQELFHEAGEKALDRTRSFYHQHLGSHPADLDSLDATAALALIKWAKRRRGFEFSRYRAGILPVGVKPTYEKNIAGLLPWMEVPKEAFAKSHEWIPNDRLTRMDVSNEVAEHLNDFLQNAQGKATIVVDAGGGNGELSFLLAEHLHLPDNVLIVVQEVEPKMIEEGRERFSQITKTKGLKANIIFSEGSSTENIREQIKKLGSEESEEALLAQQYKDAPIAAIMSTFAMGAMKREQLPTVAGQVTENLSSGGKFVIADFANPDQDKKEFVKQTGKAGKCFYRMRPLLKPPLDSIYKNWNHHAGSKETSNMDILRHEFNQSDVPFETHWNMRSVTVLPLPSEFASRLFHGKFLSADKESSSLIGIPIPGYAEMILSGVKK